MLKMRVKFRGHVNHTFLMILEHCYNIIDDGFWGMPPALRLAYLVWITPLVCNEIFDIKHHGDRWEGRVVSVTKSKIYEA